MDWDDLTFLQYLYKKITISVVNPLQNKPPRAWGKKHDVVNSEVKKAIRLTHNVLLYANC